MAYALCVMEKYGYRHTLRIRTTYCFSTATIVTRMRLDVSFIRTLLSFLRVPVHGITTLFRYFRHFIKLCHCFIFAAYTLCIITWGVQVLRSPNLFKKNYSPREAENAVISQRNHPLDIHIFHNAHATIAWPQQTLL